jgi:chromate transporter
MRKVVEVFLVFLRLGVTSFGGPIAHLSYFHNEFVRRKKWMDENTFTEVVALCQFLPGPASSQVGIAVGLHRAGYIGAIVAWLGFTLPSAILLVLFGLSISSIHLGGSWLHGLKIVAVAVVAQAVWGMVQKLCPDKERIIIAVLSAGFLAMVSWSFSQLLVILIGGIIGSFFLRKPQDLPKIQQKTGVSRTAGFTLLLFFILLLITLPIAAKLTGLQSIQLFDTFFRVGSLVFGGGHVVLPLLQTEVLPSGWVSKDLFMAGYGAAQAIPGPLFAFTAFLGAVSSVPPHGWIGATICLCAVFMPSFLLVIGIMPFWNKMRRYPNVRFAMSGINAAVVGLMIAAFFNPVCTSAIKSAKDFSLAVVSFLLLAFCSVPPWAVVLVSTITAGIFL